MVDRLVSRSHAAIGYDGDAFFVQDLGSTNGTRVNGKRSQKTSIKSGDDGKCFVLPESTFKLISGIELQPNGKVRADSSADGVYGLQQKAHSVL